MSKSKAQPSTILNDALSSFSKAAHVAFTALDEQRRSEVARANAETLEARRERDEAAQNLHNIQIEVESLKAAVEMADMTNKHQLEVNSQLRRDVQRWEDHSQKLEESSRKEIEGWKEQFMKADKERARLHAKLNELTTAQSLLTTQSPFPMPQSSYPMYPPGFLPGSTPVLVPPASQASTPWNHPVQPPPAYKSKSIAPEEERVERKSTRPLTSGTANKGKEKATPSRRVQPVQVDPTPPDSDEEPARRKVTKPAVSANRTKESGTTSRRKSVAYVEISPPVPDASPPAPTSPAKSKTSRQRPSTSKAPAAQKPHNYTSATPHNTVVRRVTAVFQVPVKEESDDDGTTALQPRASTSTHAPHSSSAPVKRRAGDRGQPMTSSSATKKRKLVPKVVDEDEGDDEGVVAEQDFSGEDGDDGDEYRDDEETDDDDDELILGRTPKRRLDIKAAPNRPSTSTRSQKPTLAKPIPNRPRPSGGSRGSGVR